MGFKQWLARHTTKPSDFGRIYAGGLVELIDQLTAYLIVFSGKRAVSDDKVERERKEFANHFEMEMAGFIPFDKAIGCLISPDLENIAVKIEPDFLYNTFRNTTAFLCLASENAAHRFMKPKNATLFSSALYQAIAERNAGRFGFSSDPIQVARVVHELLPLFRCDKLLNSQSFGKDDCLEQLINNISLLKGSSSRYGFVVGSKQQSLGCAAAMVEVLLEIEKALQNCAKDLCW
ncbi:MAG: hypothetical protein EG826_06660 [Deltaproteobacteria bacterium]|nr:hypothetical protein [Deltaproteobacteria bacterium]